MKSRTPLAMTEQVLMILAFSLAAAVCLKVFAGAASLSERTMEADAAQRYMSSAAQILKNTQGDFEKCARVFGGEPGDESMTAVLTEDGKDIKLSAERIGSGNGLLGKARVTASLPGGDSYSLEVCWQETGA